MRLNLPIQNVIDRRVVIEPFRQRKPAIGPDGTLRGFLEVGGEFGGVPGDPPPWQRRVPYVDPVAAAPGAAFVLAMLGAL